MFNNGMMASVFPSFTGQTVNRKSLRGGTPSIGTSPLGEIMGQLLGNNSSGGVKLKDVNWALKRFPELSYHVSAIATFASFANTLPWAKRRLFGPGGINVTFSPKLSSEEATAEIVRQAVDNLSSEGLDTSALLPKLHKVIESSASTSVNNPRDIHIMRALIAELVQYNKLHFLLYNAAMSLLCYNVCIFDYSEDYSTLSVYSPNDLKLKSKDSDNRPRWAATDVQDASIDVGELIVIATGKPLSDRAHSVVVGNGQISDSTVGKVVHYLRILDLTETALSVERMTKSVSFLVWMVGVDGLPGEQITDYLGAYRGIVMSRLRTGLKDKNLVSAEVSKSLTASHLFVPNYKESPTDVKPISLNYRPLLEDITYWWQKVFMAMGIPPYYSISAGKSTSTTNMPRDVSAFHESVFGARVRMYQSLLEDALKNWIDKFLLSVLDPATVTAYTSVVSLPSYVSGGEEGRTEYMKRINQFASAYSTLSISGMPLKPEFATALMFPNSDPTDVIDWRIRDIQQEQQYGLSGGVPTEVPDEQLDDADVNSMLDTMVQGEIAPEIDPNTPWVNPEETKPEEI